MVFCRVHGINADDVCINLLQIGNVASAGATVGERVSVARVLAGGAVGLVVLLICDALEETELSVQSREEHVDSVTYNCVPLLV
jgi:hypothetical protein